MRCENQAGLFGSKAARRAVAVFWAAYVAAGALGLVYARKRL